MGLAMSRETRRNGLEGVPLSGGIPEIPQRHRTRIGLTAAVVQDHLQDAILRGLTNRQIQDEQRALFGKGNTLRTIGLWRVGKAGTKNWRVDD